MNFPQIQFLKVDRSIPPKGDSLPAGIRKHIRRKISSAKMRML